ncbi:MAG: chemotaxis protein CheC [Hymenobacteraceae bacterium]|nr:chemotaxis protein CheC [Hymenobacteraceae bacterium]
MPALLTAVEKDTLREILNIGLARAADSFALVAQGRVLLTIPEVLIVAVDEMLDLARSYGSQHFLVQSDIRGDFNGATLLAFSAEHIQRLSEVCLRQKAPASLEISEMQRSLLLEVSNILTGALVTQLANLLKVAVYGAPPTTPGTDLAASLQPLITAEGAGMQPLVFTVMTHFQDSTYHVELPLLLFFDRPTFERMLGMIRSEEFKRMSHLR